MKSREEIEKALAEYAANCNGTEKYYRYNPPFVLLTDGAKHFADTCGAYWLLDIIASWQLRRKSLPDPDFQVWKIKRKGDGAEVFCSDGNDAEKKMQSVSYTDFPLDEFTLWVERTDETRFVILIPAEH